MSEETVSEAVLAAVAEREGVDVEDLHPPLYESISPDALDELFRTGSVEVRFEYNGYIVTVDTDRQVKLVPK